MIDIIPDNVLYQKRNGEYFPVALEVKKQAIPTGHWHLHIKGNDSGISLIQRKIKPNYVELLAALKEWRDVVIECLYEASKMRSSRRVSKDVSEAFDKLMEKLGDSAPTLFGYQEIEDIVDESVQLIDMICNED